MTVVNTIFAITDDKVSATSFDGTTWVSKTLPSTQTWQLIAGEVGKFLYYASNIQTPLSRVTYSIVDGIHWKLGVLPTAQNTVIVAIADGLDHLYTSLDGATFS
jgi:hypothetical protein